MPSIPLVQSGSLIVISDSFDHERIELKAGARARRRDRPPPFPSAVKGERSSNGADCEDGFGADPCSVAGRIIRSSEVVISSVCVERRWRLTPGDVEVEIIDRSIESGTV